jgi:hypothetical protein
MASPVAATLPVVRVSLAWFPPEKVDEVARAMDYAGQPLEAESKVQGRTNRVLAPEAE